MGMRSLDRDPNGAMLLFWRPGSSVPFLEEHPDAPVPIAPAQSRRLGSHSAHRHGPADRSAVASAEPDDTWGLPYTLATLALVRTRTRDPSNAAALLDRAERSAAGMVDRQACQP